MPAARLPWIKFWPELVDHPKFSELSDSERWTWVEVWSKASQQAKRWHFASVAHAVKVTGRPAKQIRTLVAAGLIDESTDGIYIHNAAKWQDRYPSDYSNGLSPNTPRTVRQHSANTPANPPETDDYDSGEDSVNDPGNAPDDVRKSKSKSKSKSKTGAAAPSGQPTSISERPQNGRSAAVIDAIRATGIEPTLTARDHAALKTSNAPPEVIAEIYCEVFNGRYGDAYQQRNLSVHELLAWIDGYRSFKTNGPPKPVLVGRNGQLDQPRRLVDNTGIIR